MKATFNLIVGFGSSRRTVIDYLAFETRVTAKSPFYSLTL